MSSKEQYEESNRANVIAYLAYDRGLMVLRVHNIGNRLAKDVKITAD